MKRMNGLERIAPSAYVFLFLFLAAGLWGCGSAREAPASGSGGIAERPKAATQPVMAQSEPAAGIKFVVVPAGEFSEGREENLTSHIYRLARPTTFSVYPITCEQYARFLQATGHQPPAIPDIPAIEGIHKKADVKAELTAAFGWQGSQPPKGQGNWPVAFISRDEATAYCQWLSKATGKTYRLPKWRELDYALLDAKPISAKEQWFGISAFYGLGPVGANDQAHSRFGLLSFTASMDELASDEPALPWHVDQRANTFSSRTRGPGDEIYAYGFRIVCDDPGLHAPTIPMPTPWADPMTLKLPDPASKLHPDYTFMVVGKDWRALDQALMPMGDNISFAIDADDRKVGKQYIRQVTYSAPGRPPRAQRSKKVTFSPEGTLRDEQDYDGTWHSRAFRPDGSISSYSVSAFALQWQEIKRVDFDEDGHVLKRKDGRGTIEGTEPRLPNFRQKAWYLDGFVFLHEEFKEGKHNVTLEANGESKATLAVYEGDSEYLGIGGDVWEHSKDKTLRTFGPPDAEPAAADAHKYFEIRREFLKTFAAQITRAGYKIEELGLDSLIPDLKAIAAEPAAQPTTKPAAARRSGS
jgi:hypothetical protein